MLIGSTRDRAAIRSASRRAPRIRDLLRASDRSPANQRPRSAARHQRQLRSWHAPECETAPAPGRRRAGPRRPNGASRKAAAERPVPTPSRLTVVIGGSFISLISRLPKPQTASCSGTVIALHPRLGDDAERQHVGTAEYRATLVQERQQRHACPHGRPRWCWAPASPCSRTTVPPNLATASVNPRARDNARRVARRQHGKPVMPLGAQERRNLRAHLGMVEADQHVDRAAGNVPDLDHRNVRLDQHLQRRRDCSPTR